MSVRKIKEKLNAIPRDIKQPKQWLNIAVEITLGFFVGVLVDIFFEAIMHYLYVPYLKDVPSRIEVGFSIYYNHPHTSIAVDDLILIFVSFGTLFLKKIWFTLGFSLGWYFSSCHDFYGLLGFPKGSGA